MTQLETIYNVFKIPMTMLDAALATKIYRANICRHIALLRERGEVQVVFRARDKHTRRVVNYYSTDRRLFRVDKPRQLSLFEEGA